jgi:GTP-binding protein
LVLNKVDLLPAADRKQVLAEIVKRREWDGPVFAISALTGEGTQALAREVMRYIEKATSTERVGATSG